MVDRALVGACTHCRVTERSELVVIWREYSPGIGSRSIENDYHEGSHEESCICLLRVVQACVVINLVCAVLLIVDEFLQLFAEKVHLPKIQGAKVCEEWLVD